MSRGPGDSRSSHSGARYTKLAPVTSSSAGFGSDSDTDDSWSPPSYVRANGEAAAQIQNVKNAKVYVFGNDDLVEEEINTDHTSIEMPKIRSRGSHDHFNNASVHNNRETDIFYLSHIIEDSDTLQSISLKYGCPVAEIKRVNKLMKDMDLFALKVLKVPVKKYGILHEQTTARQKPENVSFLINDCDDNVDCDPNFEPKELTQELLVRTLSIKGTISNQGSEASDFLKRMDSDIKNILISTKNSKDSLEEVTASLTCRRIQPMTGQSSWFLSADCGILKWRTVLTLMVLVVVVLPCTAAVIYYVHSGDLGKNNTSHPPS